ncbi:MAG: hypothetical protein ABIP06_13465 [Pyrinomonadaceae bacterium]
MDIYHKVLIQLFEETGGSDSKAVDFADLVKRMKFHASYTTIFKEMSVQGWIIETSKPDWVKLSHWGIEEVKKSNSGDSGDSPELKKDSNRLLSEARELSVLAEKMTMEITKENISSIEVKISQINVLVGNLKSRL